MTSPSKIKGSGYERQIAKFLTETYGLTFIRNISGSGAYIGGSNNLRKSKLTEAQIRHAKGDIVPPDEFPLFNAEAKFYGDMAFHQLLDTSAQLERWLDQLMEASDPQDVNILFFKINRRGQFVAVQASLDWCSDCSYTRYKSSKHSDWMIFTHENFFKYNTHNLKSFCNKVDISVDNT